MADKGYVINEAGEFKDALSEAFKDIDMSSADALMKALDDWYDSRNENVPMENDEPNFLTISDDMKKSLKDDALGVALQVGAKYAPPLVGKVLDVLSGIREIWLRFGEDTPEGIPTVNVYSVEPNGTGGDTEEEERRRRDQVISG